MRTRWSVLLVILLVGVIGSVPYVKQVESDQHFHCPLDRETYT